VQALCAPKLAGCGRAPLSRAAFRAGRFRAQESLLVQTAKSRKDKPEDTEAVKRLKEEQDILVHVTKKSALQSVKELAKVRPTVQPRPHRLSPQSVCWRLWDDRAARGRPWQRGSEELGARSRWEQRPTHEGLCGRGAA
jgi:hypothetical protein